MAASSTITPTAFTASPLLHPYLPPSYSPSLHRHRAFLPLRPPLRVSRKAAVSTTDATPSSSGISLAPEEEEAIGRVGSRVRVKGPLKVYHIPKVPELDLTGMEGVLKQYACLWKGKRISANLPFKVEFVLPDGVDARPGPLKFFAHLREDEFEYVSGD